MILPSPELLLALGSILVSLWCAVAVVASRTHMAGTSKKLAAAMEQCRAECGQTTARALREFETTEARAAATDPVHDPGRLHRSTRSRAIKLLRSGCSIESTASTLQIPRKDIALLSRVTSILTSQK